MKSSVRSSLAALLFASATLAAPNPHPNPEPVTTITVSPVPATVAASEYPNPTTNEFKYVNYDEKSDEDKGDRYIVHAAFIPFAPVLQAAISSVANSADDTYKRWFPDNVKHDGKPSTDGRAYVANVYRRVLAPDATKPTPQPRVKDLIHDHRDFGDGCKDKTRAYMVGANGQFHICKPKGLLDQPMIADKANCSKLGTQVSEDMQSLSGTIIHEFMHWNEVGEKVPDSVGHITDVIRGASSCMRLADGADKQKTFINADSYKWMALNAYYNNVCNKNFGDPVITQEDFDLGEAELLDSGAEYNPDVSSGVLAGV